MAGSPSPSTVADEGSNLSASATCTDEAGNTTTSTVAAFLVGLVSETGQKWWADQG